MKLPPHRQRNRDGKQCQRRESQLCCQRKRMIVPQPRFREAPQQHQPAECPTMPRDSGRSVLPSPEPGAENTRRWCQGWSPVRQQPQQNERAIVPPLRCLSSRRPGSPVHRRVVRHGVVREGDWRAGPRQGRGSHSPRRRVGSRQPKTARSPTLRPESGPTIPPLRPVRAPVRTATGRLSR